MAVRRAVISHEYAGGFGSLDDCLLRLLCGHVVIRHRDPRRPVPKTCRCYKCERELTPESPAASKAGD